jgi:hypothetical protein
MEEVEKEEEGGGGGKGRREEEEEEEEEEERRSVSTNMSGADLIVFCRGQSLPWMCSKRQGNQPRIARASEISYR